MILPELTLVMSYFFIYQNEINLCERGIHMYHKRSFKSCLMIRQFIIFRDCCFKTFVKHKMKKAELEYK